VVRVYYDEGVANHIASEQCAGIREASAGERAGQPLSRDRKLIPGADAVCVVEGDMFKSAQRGQSLLKNKFYSIYMQYALTLLREQRVFKEAVGSKLAFSAPHY
jgi:hypothetical protein